MVIKMAEEGFRVAGLVRINDEVLKVTRGHSYLAATLFNFCLLLLRGYWLLILLLLQRCLRS